MFSCIRNSQTLPKHLTVLYSQHKELGREVFFYSTALQKFTVVILDFGHSDSYIVVSSLIRVSQILLIVIFLFGNMFIKLPGPSFQWSCFHIVEF